MSRRRNWSEDQAVVSKNELIWRPGRTDDEEGIAKLLTNSRKHIVDFTRAIRGGVILPCCFSVYWVNCIVHHNIRRDDKSSWNIARVNGPKIYYDEKLKVQYSIFSNLSKSPKA